MSLYRTLDTAEGVLWMASIVPVVNLVSGPAKALLGTIQAVCGIALAAFSTPFCVKSEGRKCFRQGVKHVIHGFGNIVSGALFAIPLIGNVIAFVSYVNCNTPKYWHYNSRSYRSNVNEAPDNEFVYIYHSPF